jgi:hypothetical protein
MTYKQLIITVLVAIYALLATYVFPKYTTTYIMTCIIFILWIFFQIKVYKDRKERYKKK